ncbi:MAG: hypothetical protein ACPF9K_14585, partial [Neptuniibacter sp.]
MYQEIFVGTWIVGVALTLKVRFRLKKLHPDLYIKLCGKNWMDNSLRTSISWTSFALKKSHWSSI